MHLVIDIANRISPVAEAHLQPLQPCMVQHSVVATDHLFHEGDINDTEYFVLSGLLRSYVISHDGCDITLGFYSGPCIFSPSVTRCSDGKSRIHCEALQDTTVVSFAFSSLVHLMQKDNIVQAWGDAVLRQDLLARAQREWVLATMSGADKLAEFRKTYENLEQQVPHYHIASFLGITPVTLSRLRKAYA